MPHLEDYTSQQPQPASDGLGDKVWRELALAGHGFGAVPQEAVNAITERPVETALRVSTAAGLSMALGYAYSKPGLRTIAQSAAVGLGIPMLADFSRNIGPTLGAFSDNWNSSANWDANVHTLETKFAPFVVDTAFSLAGASAAGYSGALIGKNARRFEPTLPKLTERGFLPEGIHQTSWNEFATTFGGTERRQTLLRNMEVLLREAKAAGGDKVYVGGSFVSRKLEPTDFDMTWRIDGKRVGELKESRPILVDRSLQEETLGGQLMVTYPNSPNDGIVGFLQRNNRHKINVGIVELDLSTLPSNFNYRVRSMFGNAGAKVVPEIMSTEPPTAMPKNSPYTPG